MKKNILIYINRSYTSKYNKSLIEQMSVLREYDKTNYTFTLLTHYKTSKPIEYVESVANIKFDDIINFDEFYESIVFSKKYDTWLKLYESKDFEDKTIELGKVDKVYMFGGILSKAANLRRETNGLDLLMLKSGQMNFKQVGISVTGALLCLRASTDNDCELNEFCYDVSENSLNLLTHIKPKKYRLLHGYDLPDLGIERFDSLQYYLKNSPQTNIHKLIDTENEKIYNIVFGMTILTEDRLEIYNNVQKINNVKLFVKNKFDGTDTFIPRDEYIDYIKQSRFTIIIPTYDKRSFSIYRLIESVYYDCLSLFTRDCYLVDIIKTFNFDERIINKLIIDYNEIKLLDERERLEILTYLKDKLFNEKLKLN